MIVKHSHAVNHYRSLNLTKLDVLDTFPEIPIATAYKVDGQQLEYFPADLEVLSRVEVIYTTLPGWNTSTTGVTKWDDLPENAKAYVTFIEDYLKGSGSSGPKCRYIGTGMLCDFSLAVLYSRVHSRAEERGHDCSVTNLTLQFSGCKSPLSPRAVAGIRSFTSIAHKISLASRWAFLCDLPSDPGDQTRLFPTTPTLALGNLCSLRGRRDGRLPGSQNTSHSR